MSKFDYRTAERGPWQSGETVPPVPGVYERDYKNTSEYGVGVIFCKWDGKYWHAFSRLPWKAAGYKSISFYQTTAPWRGLLNKPEV